MWLGIYIPIISRHRETLMTNQQSIRETMSFWIHHRWTCSHGWDILKNWNKQPNWNFRWHMIYRRFPIFANAPELNQSWPPEFPTERLIGIPLIRSRIGQLASVVFRWFPLVFVGSCSPKFHSPEPCGTYLRRRPSSRSHQPCDRNLSLGRPLSGVHWGRHLRRIQFHGCSSIGPSECGISNWSLVGGLVAPGAVLGMNRSVIFSEMTALLHLEFHLLGTDCSAHSLVAPQAPQNWKDTYNLHVSLCWNLPTTVWTYWLAMLRIFLDVGSTKNSVLWVPNGAQLTRSRCKTWQDWRTKWWLRYWLDCHC